MHLHRLGRKVVLPLLASLLVMFWVPCPTQAGDLEKKGRAVSIIYSNPEQLKIFIDKISPGAQNKTITRILASGSNDKGVEEYLDQVLRHVQIILDMPVSGMKLKVKLYNDPDEVALLYKQQISKGTAIAHQTARPLAFYWKKDNTIHIQVQQVHLGMLAHEMAHAIMFHFFIPPPPLKIQEMLAIYVDREIYNMK